MIANFYKITDSIKVKPLLASKNISCIPKKGEYVMLSGQCFRVFKVIFDIDKCEYNLYLMRV